MKKLLLLILFFIVSITSVNAKVHYIGDVDDNGKISVSDYLLIRKHIIGTITLTDSENKRADVNRDNKISAADYISIRKIIINNETPVELPPEFQYIDIPTKDLCVAKTYNGQDQQLTTITSTTGYTLSNYNGKDAGEYTITAKLSQGYKWADKTDTDKTFKCSIDKAMPKLTISHENVVVNYNESLIYTIKTDVAGVIENKRNIIANINLTPTKIDAKANTEYKVTVTGKISETTSIVISTINPTDTKNYQQAELVYNVVTNKASNVVTITEVSKSYTGSGIATTVKATNGTPTVTYYTDSSCKTKTTTANAISAGGTPKAVGTYYAIATVPASTNYVEGKTSCTKAVVIKKLNNTVTINEVSKTYTGSGIATTAKATNGTPTVTYYTDSSCKTKTTTANATAAGGTPKAVGTYYAIATVAASTNYNEGKTSCTKAVVINKINNNISVTLVSKTYNGSAVSASVTATSGTPTVTYYSDASCKTKTTTSNATAVGGTPKNAGTYYVKATITASTNYNAGDSGCKEAVIINKAANAINLTKKTYTYDGGGKAATVTATYGTPTVTYYSDASCNTKTTTANATAAGGTPKNAGIYYAKATVDASTNYKAESTGCKEAVVINRLSNNVTITLVTKTYTGSGIATTAKATSGTPSVTYYSDSTCKTKTTTSNATSAGGTPKTVGTYYAIGSVTANGNYAAVSSSCTKAVVINSLSNSVTITLVTKTYTGSGIATTAKATSGTPTVTYYSDSTCKTKTTTTNATSAGGTPKSVGTYYAIGSVKANGNYAAASSSCTKAVVINKINNTVTITAKTYTYDGGGKATTATATNGTPTITYYSDSSCATKTTTSNATSAGGTPKNAGTYYAKAIVTASTNYNEGNSGCKQAVIINKASNAITITKKSYTWDGNGKAATVTATYGTPTVTYYSDSSCNTKTTTTNATSAGGTPKAAGTYYAKATVDASTNYKAESTGCKEAVVITRQYTVTYKPNGGSGSNTTQTVDYNTDWTTKGSIFTRTNYNLAGWSTSASGSVTHNLNKAQGKWTSSSDLTLYAVWQAKQYKLTYNANGGSVSPASKSITYGGTYGTLATPTRSGYTFIGWYTSSTNGFDAEYYANKYADLKAAYGSNSTSLLNHWVDNGMREGRISSSTYVKSDMAHGATADKTIYAHWRANTYSVTYNPNGGSGSNVSQNITYNTDWTTKDKIFTRDGYELVGWSTTANGNVTHSLNKAQGKWTNASHLTLYAVWNKVSSYVITEDSKYDGYTNVAEYNSATLKYRIIKYQEQDIVLIYVADPYMQLNGALATSDALHSLKAEDILANEIKKYSYEKKGMIAVNASFYSPTDNYNGTPWDGVVINHGQVVKETGITGAAFGILPNGMLKTYWQDTAAKLSSEGIRNTFVFSSDTARDPSTVKTNRTQICQYDKNNFVLLSGKGTVRACGEQITTLTGCKTPYNLDGGDSRKLYYKTSGSSEMKKRYGTSRVIPDMLYFVEK